MSSTVCSSLSETCLLLYVHEHFAISLHLFVFYYYICGYCDVQITSFVVSYRHLTCHLSTFRRFVHSDCFLIHIYKQLNGDLKGIAIVMNCKIDTNNELRNRFYKFVHLQLFEAKFLFSEKYM